MNETLRERKDKAAHLFASGALEAALAEYQALTREAPDDLASAQKVGDLLQRLGRKREAISAYESVAAGWARQGWLLRAIALCKVILQLEPGHGKTQRMLAEYYARQQAPQPRLSPAPAPVAATPAPGAQSVAPGALPRVPLFSQLGPDAFVALLEGLELKTFEPGATLVTEGAPGDSLFAIVEGRVDVVRHLMGGGFQRKVASMGEGEFFGELALLSQGIRLATVIAAERTVVLELTRERVAWLVKNHPSVEQVLRAFYDERLLANVLRSHPLLSALTPMQREAAAKAFQVHTAAAGETLLTQGQPGAALYLVLRGQCQVVQRLQDGTESELPSLREGDVFGEVSVLLGVPATATVRTRTPCTLLRLDREAAERHILIQPGVREALARLSTERLRRTERVLSGHELLEGDLRV